MCRVWNCHMNVDRAFWFFMGALAMSIFQAVHNFAWSLM